MSDERIDQVERAVTLAYWRLELAAASLLCDPGEHRAVTGKLDRVGRLPWRPPNRLDVFAAILRCGNEATLEAINDELAGYLPSEAALAVTRG